MRCFRLSPEAEQAVLVCKSFFSFRFPVMVVARDFRFLNEIARRIALNVGPSETGNQWISLPGCNSRRQVGNEIRATPPSRRCERVRTQREKSSQYLSRRPRAAG
jgi:hypothetical protein